jgi:mediator of RNA polymerase II transcription subunit 12
MTKLCKSFFDGSSSPTSPSLDPKRLEEKIFILLNWAMGLYQLGIHRPYGVYTLLKMWSEQRYEYVATASAPTPPVDLFPHLYNWLDNSVAAKKESNVQAIGITFGEFTRQGLFSYGRFLQALIARGHTARSRPNGPVSHHLALLSAMPIFVQAKDLLQQRRIALSGDDMEQRRADEAAETAALQAFKDEVEEYIPEIFDSE